MLIQPNQMDPISLIIWFIIGILFFLFGPRLMYQQSLMKLEKDTEELEEVAEKSRGFVIKSLKGKTTPKVRESIKNFMDFFAISPIETDPYGVIKKIDHIVRNSDQRFTYFVDQIAPHASEADKRDIKNALEGAMMTHQIAKIVRHYLETIKKYKMYQMAMIIQMQIPLIARISKAAMHATKAFTEAVPIGDGIGPLVVTTLIKEKPQIFKEEEFVITQAQINGRSVWIAKAEGPGASTGYPGKFLIKFFKKHKIDRLITIDAALRLEGEKTGSIAEGVGVAMGGTGVDRYEIEEIAVKRNIPLDAIAVKVSDEEALMPMRKDIFDSVPDAIEAIKENLKRAKKNENILIIGVGNTCGIGNTFDSIKIAEKKLREHHRKSIEKKKPIITIKK